MERIGFDKASGPWGKAFQAAVHGCACILSQQPVGCTAAMHLPLSLHRTSPGRQSQQCTKPLLLPPVIRSAWSRLRRRWQRWQQC